MCGAHGAWVAATNTRRCSRSHRQNAVPLIGLNWKDDNAAAQEWLRMLGNPYAAVAEDAEGRVAIDWGVYGAPETFLIGPDGKVLCQAHRADDDGSLERRNSCPASKQARASRTAQATG